METYHRHNGATPPLASQLSQLRHLMEERYKLESVDAAIGQAAADEKP